jgi:hypothetical protein
MQIRSKQKNGALLSTDQLLFLTKPLEIFIGQRMLIFGQANLLVHQKLLTLNDKHLSHIQRMAQERQLHEIN